MLTPAVIATAWASVRYGTLDWSGWRPLDECQWTGRPHCASLDAGYVGHITPAPTSHRFKQVGHFNCHAGGIAPFVSLTCKGLVQGVGSQHGIGDG